MEEKMVQAIKDGQIQWVSEKEAREDGLIVLKKNVLQENFVPPSGSPWKSAEKREAMRPILMREIKDARVSEDIDPYFHWSISRARRARNLTRSQLANIMGVGEEQIIFLERGDLPKGNRDLIMKLEKYLGIKIFKNPVVAPKIPDSQKSYPKDVTLADLQKRKEINRKLEPKDSKNIFGDDIKLIE